MNKGIKKLAVYATVGTLSLGTLVGCGEKDKSEKENIEELVEQGDKRVFDTGHHLFYIRTYNTKGIYSQAITGGYIENIPENYEVCFVENFAEKIDRGSQTAGYDVWFKNLTPVEVEAVYNRPLKEYDYSNFGTSIEKEETMTEESVQKIK